MQLNQEGWLIRQCKHAFLNHCAFNVIVLDNDILLQDFNGIQFVGSFSLRQQDLELD
jgi:hypothetical protein